MCRLPESIKERITSETAKFFGLTVDYAMDSGGVSDDASDGSVADEVQKWQQRRFRHLKREYGVRMDALADEMQPKIGNDVLTELTDDSEMTKTERSLKTTKRRLTRMHGVIRARSMEYGSGSRLARIPSARRTVTAAPPTLETRQSVAQMVIGAINAILHGKVNTFPRSRRRNSVASSSINGTTKRGTVIARNSSSASYGGGDVVVLSSDADIYCPIRQRNLAGTSTSFPAIRQHALSTVGEIACADDTVRKISDFFCGVPSEDAKLSTHHSVFEDSSLLSPSVALATRLDEKDAAETIESTVECQTTSDDLRCSMDDASRSHAISARLTGFNTLPFMTARRPNYLPLEPVLRLSNGVMPLSASQLDAGAKMPAQCRQSHRPSVTTDDLFFDISPSRQRLTLIVANEQRPRFGLHDRTSSEEISGVAGELRHSIAELTKSTAQLSSAGGVYKPRCSQYRQTLHNGNSYELDENVTPMTDGMRSSIYTRTPSFCPVASRVEFRTDTERVDIVAPLSAHGVAGVVKPTASEKRSSLLRHPRWLKSLSVSTSGDSGFRSLRKLQFSTRNGYAVAADSVSGKPSLRKKSYKRSLPIFGSIDPEIARQLRDESCDYRPFFTFWITTVQVAVMLVMLLRYGVGTDFTLANYFSVIERSGDVTSTFLSMSHIVVWEQNNVWIGPRFADLVHAGAKYTPCMRQDASIHAQILLERHEESLSTGCCIAAESGCFQGSECPKQFARLIKWSNMSSFDPAENDHGAIIANVAHHSLTRVVCGQDPRYCLRPKSVAPFEWNRTDISTWPVCEENRASKLIPRRIEHMHCTITGRPCCIQMHGQCRITTPEYCAFVRGYYHVNATLCSQVSCLNSVCGMTPFLSADHPDQIYRLITPLFMHAGVIRCVISIFLQMRIMRNFEVMIGWLRLLIIYFVSGVGGNLASAVFVPYMPEVGPAGSQGGVLGALIVNVLYNWNFLRYPARTLGYHLAIAAALFVTGLLPFVDNWAQLFGFVFGCLLAAALIPYIVFGKYDAVAALRRRRLVIVVGSLTATTLLFVVLFTMFYTIPATSFAAYDVFRLLNCPFSGKVCDQQGLFLRSWLPI